MKNAEQKKYSISEFAKACGTTKDTLYHYEKQGLLIPAFDAEGYIGECVESETDVSVCGKCQSGRGQFLLVDRAFGSSE